MNKTLYRAVATSRSLLETVHVFAEFDIWAGTAESQLTTTLARLWCVQPADIAICNLRSEEEQLAAAVGVPYTGDARLFELPSIQGAVNYIDERATLMLVTPKTLRRLLAARERLPSLAVTNRPADFEVPA